MATVIVGYILCSTCESSKKRKKLYGPSPGDVRHVLQSLAAVHGVEIIGSDETSFSLYLQLQPDTLSTRLVGRLLPQ